MNDKNNEILLHQRISKLPQELRDHINTYNVEHRQLMKEVCKLLFYYKEIKCHNCDKMVKRINPETVTIGGYYDYCYCTMDCFYNDTWI